MAEHVGLSLPDVGPREQEYLLRAARSGWIAPLGPEVDAFEAELAAYCGRGECVALSSGTAALHLGLLALGVRPGGVVVTATMTFAATANAIVYTGAEPMFVDCDASGCIDPELLELGLAQLAGEGRQAQAVLPVDLLGHVADHKAISEIASRYGIPVLSDAAESMGASLGGRPAASFGTAAAVSFNGNKVMTTSGGGALLVDDPAMARRVRYLATQARQPVAWYEHTEVGYNYRMSNLLAALGRAQLERLDAMVAARRRLRERYKAAFAGVPGAAVLSAGCAEDNAWLSAVIVEPGAAGWDVAQLGEALGAAGIESRPLWKPMHLQPVFAGARSWLGGESERLFRNGLTLPSGSSLTDADKDRVFGVIRDFLRERGV
ncbi:MAG: aminotransferase class I/II-fold pyridoxal phosphate-dependent enzyme [Bifidobacteriaceae bacterium]|jgi:dTDP-4-amino-4,6-dideoxygalactose transaminase|nr:aminotransferase class I/II-fold pyridoxal phosphate-dependent enzyme [Bifidobacteriaceae bacterium]